MRGVFFKVVVLKGTQVNPEDPSPGLVVWVFYDVFREKSRHLWHNVMSPQGFSGLSGVSEQACSCEQTLLCGQAFASAQLEGYHLDIHERHSWTEP